MPSLPSEVSYGHVTGRVVTAVKDTPADVDTLPDAVPATGQIIFTPTSMLVSAISDVIILPQKIVNVLDANGAFEVDLVATDDPDLIPVGWLYTVSFKIAEGQIPSFFMAVPSGSNTDLSDVIAAGTPPTPSQVDALTARVAALESRPRLYVQATAPTAPHIDDIWVTY